VTTLFALAQALSVPVDALFGEESPPAVVVANGGDAEPARTVAESSIPLGDINWRAPGGPLAAVGGSPNYMLHRDDRLTIDIRGGVRWERLTPTSLMGLEFLELVYQPGAESDPSLYRHPGIELVLVLENRLDIHVGFDLYQLGAGDSIGFPSSTPHRYVNPTEDVTRAVTVIVRDDLSSMPTAGARFEQDE
jgi:mannose-6-phosphate isomerase-like protein (cupin superfamily)